jgi:hypothetical protein
MIRRFLQRVARALRRRWLRLTGISSFVLPEQRVGEEVTRLVVVAPRRRVQIGRPDEDAFIPVSKYYRDGFFQQPDIFVAEIPSARLHVGSGLVCTPGFRALADSDRLDRLGAFSAFGQAKPRRLEKRPGAQTTLQYCYANNPWHWVIDCLPKLISLERALGERELTILMPDTISSFQRDSMLSLLPRNFSVEYLPAETWIESETFFWASLASGRCNAFLPPGYFEEMRARFFSHHGLSGHAQPHRRLYITRRNAKHRRVKNEAETWALLQEFGFELIELERLTFREQVELFQEAAVVAGPHGAGLVSTVFSGPLTLLVFYATQKPPNYFHTQARALGQRHLFLTDDAAEEDDDFSVHVGDLRHLLQNEIRA